MYPSKEFEYNCASPTHRRHCHLVLPLAEVLVHALDGRVELAQGDEEFSGRIFRKFVHEHDAAAKALGVENSGVNELEKFLH